MAKGHHHTIYKMRWHMFATLLFILVPILFFLGFSLVTHITIAQLFADISVSLMRLVIAFVISIVLGWVLAAMFYRGKASTVALPVFDVLQSVPTFAALPIAVMYWGRTNTTVIFFLVLAIIWPVLFSIISSLKLIKNEYNDAVSIYGLKGWRRVRYFLLPASIPGLITGAIIGLGEAWEAIIATEMIIGMRHGLGTFFQGFSNNPQVTAFGMLGVLMFVFAINKLFLLPMLDKSHSLVEE